MTKKSPADTTRMCRLKSSPRLKVASDAEANAIKGNFPPGIPQPALRALASAGLLRLEDLTTITEQQLSALHGVGPKAVTILVSALQKAGLSMKE
ncbi:MAG: hypothetical protein WDZ51_03120 [Pirellulaceae bacterium]